MDITQATMIAVKVMQAAEYRLLNIIDGPNDSTLRFYGGTAGCVIMQTFQEDGVIGYIQGPNAGGPEFAERIRKAREPDIAKRTWIVMSGAFHWARGETPKEAAKNALELGCSRSDQVGLFLFLGDDSAEVSLAAEFVRSRDSYPAIFVGKFSIGQILKSSEQ